MNVPEATDWLVYAEANFAASKLLLEAGYYNPCLQEAQQAAEKALKAMVMVSGLPLKKTHSIRELKAISEAAGVDVDISIDDCLLVDSIYLPSKYPLGSALPDSAPDADICASCIAIAEKALTAAKAFCSD
jgi:HEPN domain-containing protein